MSILKNKRRLSVYEYEKAFKNFYEYAKIQINKTSKRKQKWICKPVTDILAKIYLLIMELSTGYVSYKEREEWRYNILLSSIKYTEHLQKPLYTFWNCSNTDEKNRQKWCEHINKFQALLYGMLNKNTYYQNNEVKKEMKFITYYTHSSIQKAKFLSNMRELHQFSHQKLIHAKKDFDAFESKMIAELVDDAWYHCLEANKKIPETQEEYNERKSHISSAISCLHKMNRPLLSLFFLMEYSEKIMNTWATLLTEEIKLLSALQKADKKRFNF